MRVAVVVASRHGSTREIAQMIARQLQARGIAADCRAVGEVASLEGYDAVVIGSAVYFGRWLPEANRFIDRFAADLRRMPTWLFSSGPLGDGRPLPNDGPPLAQTLIDATGARAHEVFLGKLDPASLNLGERFITAVVHAPDGDFRDWDAVRRWADDIAAALQPTPTLSD